MLKYLCGDLNINLKKNTMYFLSHELFKKLTNFHYDIKLFEKH